MFVANSATETVGYRDHTYYPVPGTRHVFDLPTPCATDLLRFPGWRWPTPDDYLPPTGEVAARGITAAASVPREGVLSAAPEVIHVPLEDTLPVSTPTIDPEPPSDLPVAAEAAATTKPDLTAVRAWAREQGLAVAPRGRVSAEVLVAYAAREGN